MKNHINWYIPYMKVTYTGQPKPFSMWVYCTFKSYIALWSIWFSCFRRFCEENGLLMTMFNLEKVSSMIPQIMTHLVNEGKKASQNDRD